MFNKERLTIIIIVVFAIILTGVYSISENNKKEDPSIITLVAYCDQMGYKSNLPEKKCTFQEGISCDLEEFYLGKCAPEYKKEIVRKEGQVVFEIFGRCELGLKPFHNNKINQQVCGYNKDVIPLIRGQ